MRGLVKKSKYNLIYIIALIFTFVIAFSPLNAEAVPTLDFNIGAPTGGTIEFSVEDGPLIGIDIEVDTVYGTGTAKNDGDLLPLSNATLNFTTGGLTGVNILTELPMGIGWWDFGGNSALDAIQITGGIPGLIPDNTLLLSGKISQAQVIFSGNTKVEIMTFMDYKHPDLLAYYGLPMVGPPSTIIPELDDYQYQGDLNLSFVTAPNIVPGDLSFFININDAMSGDIHNYPVPEPCTLILISGLSLIGLGIIKKRWVKDSKA